MTSRTSSFEGRVAAGGSCPSGLAVAVAARDAIGIIQLRQLEAGLATAERGFAIGSPFWRTGVFMDAANVAVEFAFEVAGVTRLEARAAVVNGRGNGALAKSGAVREAGRRQSFERNGTYLDQALWSILRQEWRQSKAVWGAAIH